MDDQQNRRAESDLHAGSEREAGRNREGRDIAGMPGRRFWTPAEDATLTALYPVEPAQAIADKLGRGVRAIYMRANLLGLAKPEGWAAARMTDFATLERIARQLAEERFGAGHFDRKGTKRAYWRRKARRLIALRDESSSPGIMAALMRACGWRV